MHHDLPGLMAEATRLTQRGDLQAATAMLQTALGAGPAAPAAGASAGGPASAVPPTARFPSAAEVAAFFAGSARPTAFGAERGAPASPVPAAGEVIDVDARVVEAADRAAAPAGHAGAASPTQTVSGATPGPSADGPSGTSDAPCGTPTAGRFVAGRHANAADHRDYKLYIPPGAGQRALPLVVMLHGCTQHPDDFAAGTAMNEAALAQGFYVLYPAQSTQANPQRCWNWFKHSHQQAERGEPALLAGMTRAVMAEHRIDADRVYVAGLSAGGAMAAILGQAFPTLYAAVGVHSGLAAGSAGDLPSALAAMRAGAPANQRLAPMQVPTIAFHGDADATVHPRNAEQVIDAVAAAAGGTVEHAPAAPGAGTRRATRSVHRTGDGRVVAEHWLVHGAGHAWSGGRSAGSYTDPQGPDASAEMLRFFLEHPRSSAR